MNIIPTADESTIHADFEIARRDMFRVNLRLARPRLLLGILFFVIYAAGMIYLFWLLDDLPMLLELSPLFIGAPLLAIGGQILRLHAICRKFINRLPENQRRVEYLFSKESDGFDLTSGASFGHVAWNDVHKVAELPEHFLVYLNSYDIRFLPKRALHQQSDVSRLRDLLKTHLGAKAKLLV